MLPVAKSSLACGKIKDDNDNKSISDIMDINDDDEYNNNDKYSKDNKDDKGISALGLDIKWRLIIKLTEKLKKSYMLKTNISISLI